MTLPELLDAVKRSTMADLVNSSTDRFPQLLGRACTLFETHTLSDQMTAMAAMLGMLLGTMEGEKTEAENLMGVIITHRERLALFHEQVLVVFKESMGARGMPLETRGLLDYYYGIVPPAETKEALMPPPSTRKKTTAAVFSIASGKRKRKPRG